MTEQFVKPAQASRKRDKGTETRSRSASLKKFMSPRNIGAIYVWILIIALFSVIAPDTFPTVQTAKSIVNQYSVTGLVALSLVVPLAAAFYDLSVGFTMALSGVVVAKLLNGGMSPVEAGLVTAAACAGIGVLNFLVVGILKVDSFIGTLASGAIIAAITIGLSNDQTITGEVGNDFAKLATTSVSGIQLPVLYLIVLMLGIAYWLERTSMGRYLYALGFDRETSRLTGIRTQRLTLIAFLTSSLIAGFAGMVLAARTSAGSPEAGPSYLIPAFSAAFLGATQLRGGRFNSWGTVIAVMLIGTGNVGLILAGGPLWTPQLFEGTALILAVSLSAGGMTGIAAWLRKSRRPPRRVGREGAESV